jgi:hypothetical protein
MIGDLGHPEFSLKLTAKLGEAYLNTAKIRAKSFSKFAANGHTSIKNLGNGRTIQETELLSDVVRQGRGAAPEEHGNGADPNL